MPQKDLHEANRASWNAATQQHNTHKGDQAKFLREGGTTLYPDEVELLGDLTGKTLLHLQCNSGQDTLSIARHLGATVTGVDISDEAINFAQRLSTDSDIPGTFIRSDIYDFLAQNDEQFDVVFTSYGVLCWLSDLNAWGAGSAKALKPGGRLVLLEFHPVFNLFEYENEDWKLTYDYMGGTHYVFDGVGDYVADAGAALTLDGSTAEQSDWENPNPSHEFVWGVADVVMALVSNGLNITLMKDYPYSNGFNRFPNMIALPGRRYGTPNDMPTMPLMLGVIATKS